MEDPLSGKDLENALKCEALEDGALQNGSGTGQSQILEDRPSVQISSVAKLKFMNDDVNHSGGPFPFQLGNVEAADEFGNANEERGREDHSIEGRLQFGSIARSKFVDENVDADIEDAKDSVLLSNFVKCEAIDEYDNANDGERESSSIDDYLQSGSQINVPEIHFPKICGKKFTCELCGKQYSRKLNLTSHMRLHTGEKPHQCNVCNEKFFQKERLMSHMSAHTGEKPFQCSVCDKKYVSKRTLTSHMNYHTGEKIHQCEICDKQFFRKQSFNLHMSFHAGEHPYQCSDCDQHFDQKESLVWHMKIHTKEKPFECGVCDKQFAWNKSLKTHMTLHTGEKHQCTICEKKFILKKYLQRHYKQSHETETCELPFGCGLCEMKFELKETLDAHITKDHELTEDRPFRCTICGKGFATKKDQGGHMRVHREKTFKCDVCDRSFALAYSLKNHIMGKHSGKARSAQFRQVVLVRIPTPVVQTAEMEHELSEDPLS